VKNPSRNEILKFVNRDGSYEKMAQGQTEHPEKEDMLVFPTVLCECDPVWGELVQRIYMLCADVALLAGITISAPITAVPADLTDNPATYDTCRSGVGAVGVVQVVDHHHTAMLGSAKAVKLVVPKLTHFQESVPTIDEGTGNIRIWVTGVRNKALGKG